MRQPLDKVVKKLFKGVFCYLYYQYILPVQFIPSDNPKPPTRQLLETSVVKDWDMVPAELVRKSWTVCDYSSDYILGRTNKNNFSIHPQTK